MIDSSANIVNILWVRHVDPNIEMNAKQSDRNEYAFVDMTVCIVRILLGLGERNLRSLQAHESWQISLADRR